MPDEDYRKANYDVWQAMAESWDRERSWIWETSSAVGEWMVDALDPKLGDTVLELAAGPGDTGFAAARAVGREGRLISTDLTPNMVEAARGEAERLGLDNVECRVMDAESMDLEDNSVDGVLCRWGYMLMADPEAALRETRRVLRDGGRLALSVWAPAARNPWAAIPGKAILEHTGAPPPDPEAPGIFAMADRDRTRSRFEAAGLPPQRMEEHELVWRFPDFDAYWRFLMELAGAIALVLEAMPQEDRAAVRRLVESGVEPHRRDGGYELPAATLNVLAG